jgi:hypothetical protein
MLVMRVRVMDVAMPESDVAVTMGMELLGRLAPVVGMLVMGVVDVRALVLQCGMLVFVGMAFREMEPHRAPLPISETILPRILPVRQKLSLYRHLPRSRTRDLKYRMV